MTPTKDVRERIARAMYETYADTWPPTALAEAEDWRTWAGVALSALTLSDHIAAVEAAGLVCVPAEPTDEMIDEFSRLMWREQRAFGTVQEQVSAVYAGMLAARPRDA